MKITTIFLLLVLGGASAGETAEGPAKWTRGPYRLNEDRVMLNFDYLKRMGIRWNYEEVDNSAWKQRFKDAYALGKTRAKVDYTPIYGLDANGKPNYKAIKGYRIDKAHFFKPIPPKRKKNKVGAEEGKEQKH